MSWKCVCMCKMHGCCMGGAAFSIFRFHLIRASFHVFPVAFAAIKDRKCSRYCSLHRGIRQTHKFISFHPPSSFCLCLILFLDKCFPAFNGKKKTGQKIKNREFLPNIAPFVCNTLYFLLLSIMSWFLSQVSSFH